MKNPSNRWFFQVVILVFAVAGPALAQRYSVLYNFGIRRTDPYFPVDPGIVAQGRDGNLYSGAQGGPQGTGALFKITPGGKLTVLNGFVSEPTGGLTLATDGNFYGTDLSNRLFRITPAGRLTVLHRFTGGSDGASPTAPPIQASDGNFYGTTSSGGNLNCSPPAGCGTVYKMTPSGKLTTLFQFGPHIAGVPMAPLIESADGNLYGTTEASVFKITPAGKLTVLHNFHVKEGWLLYSPVTEGSDGNFYGTASAGGGSCYCGTIFKITPAGSFSVLHQFNQATDGGNPFGGLAQADDGFLYGVNANGTGKPHQYGNIFRISAKGDFSVVHTFDYTHGATPLTTPIAHTNGILYGTASTGGQGQFCFQGYCGVFYGWNSVSKPFVSLLPRAGKVGKTIDFLGQGFRGTTAVSFNGTAASFEVVSDTYLTAVVPSGANTGFVTVTTASGELKSNRKFRVIP